VGLLREKVTLIGEAIKVMKSDREAMMAQLKKSQKKQQKHEEMLQYSKWKQAKDNQELCVVVRRLEEKVDVETKALWAEMRRLGKLLEEVRGHEFRHKSAPRLST
jgi:transposase